MRDQIQSPSFGLRGKRKCRIIDFDMPITVTLEFYVAILNKPFLHTLHYSNCIYASGALEKYGTVTERLSANKVIFLPHDMRANARAGDSSSFQE